MIRHIVMQDTMSGPIPYWSPDQINGLCAYDPFLFETRRMALLDIAETWQDCLDMFINDADRDELPELDGWVEECTVNPDGSITLHDSGVQLTRSDIFDAFGLPDSTSSGGVS